MSRSVSVFSFVSVAILLASPMLTWGQENSPKLPETIDFNQHIRPILTQHCTSCHGGVQQAGGLSFVYADLAMGTVEPGDPDSSYLLERINDDEDSRMPPAEHGKRLPEHEVKLIRKWIEQGAKWGKHWAYELPQKHTVEKVSQPDWPRQPIDYFVLRQLDQRGVKPAQDERAERWLRRVSLDLIGLPPTIEQTESFLEAVKKEPETAYQTTVDRLLESPRFGERWASVWFDLVRYADSRGQGEDSPRTIWKYRDWVIDALNDDLPYDQFTIKQLAGDLLPNPTLEDHIATAVHRLTHTNEEGGTDDEEFRVEAILDRVNTTWQTWQGTTFGCVQCHDHPYDPFQHEEYYKFAAFFNNTVDCDLNDDWPIINVPIDKQDYAKSGELKNEIDSLTHSIWESQWKSASKESIWNPLRITKATTNKRFKLKIDAKENWDEYYTTGTIASGATIVLDMPIPESKSKLTGVRITALPLDPETALTYSEWGFVMSNISAELLVPKAESPKFDRQKIKISNVFCDNAFPRYDPNESLKDNKFGFCAYTRIHHPRQAVLTLDAATEIPAGAKLRLTIKHRVTELAAFPLLTRRAHFAISDDDSLLTIASDPKNVAQKQQLKKLKTEYANIKSTTVPVLVERPDDLARPSHVFIRGLFLTKDKQVNADVPHSLRPEKDSLPDRLQMAQWLVSADNPLTARVAVNRFWARMFGIGLVATEEDFGSTGDMPTHPELLDDLAVRFREDHNWSIKSLLKEIALSRTYRQSSQIRPELMDEDSNNRWLARGPRHSLPAETVRDQILALSGLLSDRMHGEPTFPPLPPGVWKARRGKWKTAPVGDENRYRRSVYTYVKRSVPFPISTTFDAPSRDFCLPKRLRSNTPLQPLMLLNDRGFVECAQAFAGRMTSHATDLEQQIGFGLKLATCRPAQPSEIERLVNLYQEIKDVSTPELAMQSVASVILNLDEIITK